MQQFVLYGTLGCHLCEEAEALLAPLLNEIACEIECVDIADDDALLERYGESIPVLRRLSDDGEMNWPFDTADAWTFLSVTAAVGKG